MPTLPPLQPLPDSDQADPARVYDYLLGGAHNFAADREAGDSLIRTTGSTRRSALGNRAFLRRVTEYIVRELGITQILDLGSGIPTVGNVHEVAQRVNPNARVVYVDTSATAVAHAHQLLADNPNVASVQHDLRDTAAVLDDPEVGRLLDFSRPIGILFISVLHFVAEDPSGFLTRYARAAAPGSIVAVSHFSTEEFTAERAESSQRANEAYEAATGTPIRHRSRAELTELLTGAGLRLVEPGATWVHDWRPDSGDESRPTGPSDTSTREIAAAVAEKPRD